MTDPDPCAICGAPHAAHGIGPPLVAQQQWSCGTCIGFQPATQQALARQAREAIDDAEIIIR